MALHGFRLYTVEVTSGRSRQRLPFGEGPLASPAADFARRVDELRGQTFVREAAYQPRDPDMADVVSAPARTPVMRIDTVARRGNSVEITVSYGRKGEFGFAMRLEGGEDISLEGAAAGRPYRAILHFPAVGTQAVMVSEVVSRTHVGEVLLRRLSVENYLAAEESATTRNEDGEPDQATWLRWLPNGLFDEERIREVLTEGTIEGIRLHRAGRTATGKRTSRDLTLTQAGLPSSKQDQAQKLVAKWVRKHLGIREKDGKVVGVGALVRLVDADVSNVGFTDGSLTFHEGGKTQSLGPNNLDKILMYPVSDQRPTIEELRTKSAARLLPLLRELAIPIELQ